MTELLRQSPLCQMGFATLQEDITSPVSLGGTGLLLDFQKPSLVLPHWTGRVDWTFCTNCQKPSLVQPLSAGQVDWTF